MKILFVGFLVLGSISAFACEVVSKAKLTETQKAKLLAENISIVKTPSNSRYIVLTSGFGWNDLVTDMWACHTQKGTASVKVYDINENEIKFLDDEYLFSKSKISCRTDGGGSNIVEKVVTRAIRKIIKLCK